MERSATWQAVVAPNMKSRRLLQDPTSHRAYVILVFGTWGSKFLGAQLSPCSPAGICRVAPGSWVALPRPASAATTKPRPKINHANPLKRPCFQLALGRCDFFLFCLNFFFLLSLQVLPNSFPQGTQGLPQRCLVVSPARVFYPAVCVLAWRTLKNTSVSESSMSPAVALRFASRTFP
jgi:hypothetical protein